ncbi:aldose 1-epimerase [Cupriavidus sp. BIS7]|uniref:aldose 1-epimerase n=1 Tax=Cupriavidus sp. BIS7 TaxID=1217718 RepID=UPI0003041583|nr:aldose 1-epimerase [Cupriavidus sp. BIS7]
MLWFPPVPRHTLQAGRHTLTVAPAAGGRMASFTTTRADHSVIDWLAPMPEHAMSEGFPAYAWPKAGSYPLLPFSNRIRDARFHWQGRTIVLPAHPGQPHAMHGFGHVRAWTVAEQGTSSITLTLGHTPAGDDWPWPLTARQVLALTPDGLDATLTIRNDGNSTMPVGGGFHPFFARVPGLRIQFDAAHMWPADAGGVAIGRTEVGGHECFASERQLPDTDLSVYFSGWTRTAIVQRPDGARLTMRADAGLEHFVLHAPGHSDFVCLEPVSHVADAVNLAASGWEGTGLREIGPGESVSFHMRWLIEA